MVPIAMVGGCIETVAIEHLDILLGHHLPEVFVADTTGGVTGEGLFRPENSEVDPGCLKHFSDRSCHELITLIKGTHTANRIEHIGVRVLSHQRHAEISRAASTPNVAKFPRFSIAS